MSTFTSMFMHSDMWHLLGNMIFLWAFGRRVEDACGSWRFMIFYLCAGMIANIGSESLNPSQVDLPGIGASGAISGVMGAYLILFPNGLVTCFWGIGIILRFIVVAIMKVAGVNAVKGAPTWRWRCTLEPPDSSTTRAFEPEFAGGCAGAKLLQPRPPWSGVRAR